MTAVFGLKKIAQLVCIKRERRKLTPLLFYISNRIELLFSNHGNDFFWRSVSYFVDAFLPPRVLDFFSPLAEMISTASSMVIFNGSVPLGSR